MIRDKLVVTGLVAVLVGCGPNNRPSPPSEDVSGSGIIISGSAVTGVAGGSGQSPRLVSGIKDLELSVGVDLGGDQSFGTAFNRDAFATTGTTAIGGSAP